MTGNPVPPDVRLAGNEANRQRGLERARRVLELHGSGLRGAELAAALEVAPGSVRSLLTRSRRRLGLPDPRAPKPTCTYCGDLEHPGPC